MGVAHFEALDAKVTPARIVDCKPANDPEWAAALENTDLIYFSGGNPNYLYEVMHRPVKPTRYKRWDTLYLRSWAGERG